MGLSAGAWLWVMPPAFCAAIPHLLPPGPPPLVPAAPRPSPAPSQNSTRTALPFIWISSAGIGATHDADLPACQRQLGTAPWTWRVTANSRRARTPGSACPSHRRSPSRLAHLKPCTTTVTWEACRPCGAHPLCRRRQSCPSRARCRPIPAGSCRHLHTRGARHRNCQQSALAGCWLAGGYTRVHQRH